MRNTFGLRAILSLHFVLLVWSILNPTIALAANQVTVDCGNPKAKVKTIAEGLAKLPTVGPSVLLVSGTCTENVTVLNFQYLTIQGNPAATIEAGVEPNSFALTIADSLYVTVNDLTISGSSVGVQCAGPSICRFNNVTVQDSLDAGVIFGPGSSGFLNRSTIQDSASDGLIVDAGASVGLHGSVVQNNGNPECGTFCGGVFLQNGGSLRISRDLDTSTVRTLIQQNSNGYGIRVRANSSIELNRTTITGNGTDGIQLKDGSVALFDGGNIITANAGHGVRIGDLSMAVFRGASNNLSGNVTQDDIVCDSQYSAKRTNPLGGFTGTTNCPVDVPENP